MTEGEAALAAAIEFVENQRRHGRSDAETKQHLRSARWSDEAIGMLWEMDFDVRDLHPDDAPAEVLERERHRKASQQAHDNLAAEQGHDLVIITGGIGTATCETCIEALIQGIYSRSGNHALYPPLDRVLRANPPLGHSGCGHQWITYVEEGRATDAEIDAMVERSAKRLGMTKLVEEGGPAARGPSVREAIERAQREREAHEAGREERARGLQDIGAEPPEVQRVMESATVQGEIEATIAVVRRVRLRRRLERVRMGLAR